MAPRKKHSIQITLPTRLSTSLSEDSSSPHTPLLYAFPLMPDLAAQHANDLQLDNLDVSEPAVGEKRGREDQAEVEWTDDDVERLQSILLHPYRPLSAPYPPGELPPPDVIDELTTQVLGYASKWPHSWDATRKRLFDLALEESKFGLDRKTSREGSRPGLRRVDSMDFLDQEESGVIGRTLRLSTSLQNSAKRVPKPMSRSCSEASVLDTPGAGSSTNTIITVTPSSPNPLPRRRSSARMPRPPRPNSLLQRGRSFTASDLVAEAEADEIKEDQETPLRSVFKVARPAFVTRSQSSSALHPLHPIRDDFLAAHPSSTDRASLALPLSPQPKPSSQPKSSNWSDSEDEGLPKPPAVKKMRSTRRVTKPAPSGVLFGGGLCSPFEERLEFAG